MSPPVSILLKPQQPGGIEAEPLLLDLVLERQRLQLIDAALPGYHIIGGEEHPVLQQAARTMGDVTFLGVVYEDEEAKVAGFLRQQGSTYPTLMDDGGKMAIAYGVYGVPETYFISSDGTIVDKYVGPLDASALQTLVAKAAAFSGGSR